jgi:hypothetical protein
VELHAKVVEDDPEAQKRSKQYLGRFHKILSVYTLLGQTTLIALQNPSQEMTFN